MSVETTSLAAMLQKLDATAAQATGQKIAQTKLPQGESFADKLVGSIDKMNADRVNADAQAQAYVRGDSDIALDKVMIDLKKADLSLQTGVQVRNRVVDAYKTIMNMQI